MSLNYIKPDEEFFGCMKLTSGEELLGRIVVVEEHKGFYCAFIQDPAKVHSQDKIIDDKRAVASGEVLHSAASVSMQATSCSSGGTRSLPSHASHASAARKILRVAHA